MHIFDNEFCFGLVAYFNNCYIYPHSHGNNVVPTDPDTCILLQNNITYDITKKKFVLQATLHKSS